MPALILLCILIGSTDPLAEAGGCLPVVSEVQSFRAAQDAAEVVIEGTLEVLIEDSARGSRRLYFLNSNDRRISLRFANPPGNVVTGTRVRVRGRWDPGETAFAVTSIERLPSSL